MRNLRAFLSMAAALVLAACATTAPASPPLPAASLQHAIAAVDLAEVRAAGRQAHTRGEKALARGVELGWLHRDDEALGALADARDHAPDARTRSAALWQILAVDIRRGHFAAAAEAGRQAMVADPANATVDLKQTLDFVEVLKVQQPTEVTGEASGRAPIKRDLVGLPRAPVSANGQTVDMVLDTGAGFSTIMESQARRLGLRMLDGDVSVGSTVSEALGSKLAMADVISIGDVTFRNVAFIVLPDAGLTFANGGYRIEGILGMPVFLAMRRIEIVKSAAGEEFRFGAAAGGVKGERNVLLASLTPMASAHVAASGKAPDVLMLIDSGANASTLEARFATAHPDFLAAAEARVGRVGGAGGTIKDVQQKRLASLDVRIGAATRTLRNFDVADTVREDRDGMIGQDLLKQGFVLDFERLVLELKP